jgi:large subunit ribosomal protein L7/L12
MNIDIRVHAPEGMIEISGPLAKTAPFRAILVSLGHKKIMCIKIIRSLTGMGLKEAKDASENLPFVYTPDMGYTTEDGLPPVTVEDAQRLFTEAGAVCDVEGQSTLMADILALVQASAR